MINPKNLRQIYLNAMDIDVWLPRNTIESNNSQINILSKSNSNLGAFELYVYENIDDRKIKWLTIGSTCSADADILLDKMMFAVGSERTSKVNLILNDINCLYDQIESIGPKIILLLGNDATKKILNRKESFDQIRGEVHQLKGTKVIATYHPNSLLQNPLQKRAAWHDLSMSFTIFSKDKK